MKTKNGDRTQQLTRRPSKWTKGSRRSSIPLGHPVVTTLVKLFAHWGQEWPVGDTWVWGRLVEIDICSTSFFRVKELQSLHSNKAQFLPLTELNWYLKVSFEFQFSSIVYIEPQTDREPCEGYRMVFASMRAVRLFLHCEHEQWSIFLMQAASTS